MLEDWLKFIALFVPVIGIVPLLRQIQDYSFTKNKEYYQIYEKVRALVQDSLTDNYAELLVLMNCITSRELSPKEVEWFVEYPGAFRYLKDFGISGARYLEADLSNNTFSLTPRVNTLRKRVFERLKFVGFVSFFLLVMIIPLAYLLSVSSHAAIDFFVYIVMFGCLCLVFTALIVMFGALDKAVELDRVHVGKYS
ncbi:MULTISPECIES: hypothetical protein [Vibrio]|uniref:hypothetical protein n=1 Tax=Vibrio TaxID=662 RepID=UPI002074DEA7|nr:MULTISPECIES: hypothetical protein [Vibrio]USD33662.1 hypothetical protein J8Z27_06040 [Vibrio sp. SCSIO 43186]USD46731.1 hypothetical protein J4N38_06220 [Vibrio sp. SCSIO 43145]USD70787.1 hypothetical protein J4N41_06040 [Vibrio sp. SCSIO 43139]USD95703.1 hypothetical protein CTT30_06125 [Vibrio coralliilyticus]